MHAYATFFLLLLALRSGAEPVVLEAPDPAFAARLQWAQQALETDQFCTPVSSCDDVVINALALNSLGRFDLARPALVRVQEHTPLWALADYDYWNASGDQAFIREQWFFIRDALLATDPAQRMADGGVLLAALNGLIDMAAVRGDSVTQARAQAMLPAAERAAEQRPGVFGPAFGLVNADLADAHLAFIADTVHARWPLATGLLALGFYRYHRGAEGFALLQRMAARETSSPAMFVLPLLRGLLGWEIDAPRRAIGLEPHLPAEWHTLTVQNLKAGGHTVSVAIRREDGTYSMQLQKDRTAPLSIRLSPALPRGARVTSVIVNDADMPVHLETTAYDTHVVIETTLRREATIEIEYTVPRGQPSRL